MPPACLVIHHHRCYNRLPSNPRFPISRRRPVPQTGYSRVLDMHAEQLFLVACACALYVWALKTPPVGGTFVPNTKARELSGKDAELRNKYVRLALDTLKAAIVAGYHERKDFESDDDDLVRLRQMPEFQKLLDSIPGTTKKQ